MYIHLLLKFINSTNRGVETIVNVGGESVQAHKDFIQLTYHLSLFYLNAISIGTPKSHYYAHSKPLPSDFLNATTDYKTISVIFLMT